MVTAVADDGSCEYVTCAGCTDSSACNYDSSAPFDDGTCDYVTCAGCTDASACNYDSVASIDDGSCAVLDECGVCGGPGAVYSCGCQDMPSSNCNCDGDELDLCGVCGGDNSTCSGCTYEVACNYDPTAVILDVSICEFGTCAGCTDPVATNFNPTVSTDDGSCLYVQGCVDEIALNFDPEALVDDGSCEYFVDQECGLPVTYWGKRMRRYSWIQCAGSLRTLLQRDFQTATRC